MSWKPPDELKHSNDYVLVVELVTDKQNNTTENNPYGETQEWKTHKKQFSHADEDGVIGVEIDKDIIEEHGVTHVKVKILNIDYESSLFSREVPIKSNMPETDVETGTNNLLEISKETEESSHGLKTETVPSTLKEVPIDTVERDNSDLLKKLIELIETKVLKPNETHKPFENMKVEEAKKVHKKIHHNIGMEKIW